MFCIVFAVTTATGCAPGSGDGLDTNGRPIDEDVAAMPLSAEFGSIQDNIFTPSCAIPGCHVGAAAPQGLRLDEGNSFALLVGMPSMQVPEQLRVSPGNPDSSYLILKLEGTAAVGGRMPLNGPPFLPQATVDVVRQWISDGALSASDGTLAPTVVSVTPTPGSLVPQMPDEISVIFSTDIDAALVNSTTVELLGSGGDGTFADGNEYVLVPASMHFGPNHSRLLGIDFGGLSASEDDFQLRLAGSGVIALASPTGVLLDGDKDGKPGGDFRSTFRIDPWIGASPDRDTQ